MKRRWISSILVLALCASMAGCSTGTSATSSQAAAPASSTAGSTGSQAASGNVKIGVSVLTMSGQFFIDMVSAEKKEASKKGIELMVNDAQNKSETQVAALENFIAAGCKGIIVTAVDPEAVKPVIKEAKSKGIAVICHTSKLDEYDAYIGADEYTLGQTQGLAVGKFVAKKWGTSKTIKAATLNYDLMKTVIERKKGIMDGVHKFAPNVKFVADQTAADQSAGMQATENFLQSNPDLQMVLAVSDGAALGAYEAFKANKMTDPSKYLIAGIDATSQAIKLIKDKSIYQFTVDQNPKGTGVQLIDTCMDVIGGKTVTKDNLQNLVAVSSENIANYQ